MNRISYSESLRLLREQAAKLRGIPERMPVRKALGRVLYTRVSARRPNPAAALAAMDGIAVDAAAVTELPFAFANGQWKRINTGEEVPPQFNTVIKIEDVRWEEEQPLVEKPVTHFQNVRPAAEDFDMDELLFTAGHAIGASDLALLLAAGIAEVEVLRQPVITFLPTGSELVHDPARAAAGQVPESNSAMVAGLVAEWGGVTVVHDPVPDDLTALTAAIRSALSRSEILVLSAGTSMGTRDLTSEVCRTLGAILFHGVAIHPARPVLLAQIGDVPVLGLPGYPSAACLAAILYLQPLVCELSGNKPRMRHEVYISAEEIPARAEDSFYRMQCYDVDGRVYARRIQRGASSILALSLMDGWMHVPPGTMIRKRDAVRIDLLKDRSTGAIVMNGRGHPSAFRLFDLFRAAMPGSRVLFWESEPQEALDRIIERNAHLALIPTYSGYDLFPPFEERLQDSMMRFRLFTRNVALLFRSGAANPMPGMRIAVPESMLLLWQEFLSLERVNASDLQIASYPCSEDQLAAALDSGTWDAIFADIRFLRKGGRSFGQISEHFDLVVSETHLENDRAVKKLIELAHSPEYTLLLR